MKKRFIIALDSGSKSQNDAFLNYLNLNGYGWWHWLDNFWLVNTGDTLLTATELTNQLLKTHPGIHNLVIELNANGDTWAGFGPDSDKRSMFNWLNKNWKKK